MNDADYFLHHPLENPANYRGADFDPPGAAYYRRQMHEWRTAYRLRRQSRAPCAANAATPLGAGTLATEVIADTPSSGYRGSSC